MSTIDPTFDLRGKTALVTGGGTGLGKHFAKVLAGAGARVILCARRVEKIQACADEINSSGGSAECYPMDVTDIESVKSALKEASRSGVISIVVNNAGINSKTLIMDTQEDEWDDVMATNLKGAWLVAREAAALMVEAGSGGSIINIASMLGVAVQMGTGAYSASKAALFHLTRSKAVEWASAGIRVNSIAPGYFASEMADQFLASNAGKAMVKGIPQRRLGEHNELTGPLLLLASDASTYMTGSTIVVDGGHSIPRV